MTAREPLEIDYRPRPLQMELHKGVQYHPGAEGCRFALLVCHRRFGKTVWSVNHMLRGAISIQAREGQPGRFAYMAPLLKQAKAVAWDYVKHFTKPLVKRRRPLATIYESELRVDFWNGSRFQLFGADNPDALRGIYLHGVVLDEFGLMPEATWGEVIRPTLADVKGIAVFLGTPAGQNSFYHLYQRQHLNPDWFVRVWKASETGILDDEELALARADMSEAEYLQEFECSWTAAIKGSIYGKWIEQAEADGRIHNGVLPDNRVRVYTGWDLGIGDATALWLVQMVGSEARHIGYYEAEGESLEHYVRWLESDWRKELLWAQDLLPHDAGARELIAGQSREQFLRGLGRPVRVLPRVSQTQQSEVEERIQAVRNLLPRSTFHADRCKEGLDALRAYRRTINLRTGEKLARPAHDWASHGADAEGMIALGVRERRTVSRPRPDVRWVR